MFKLPDLPRDCYMTFKQFYTDLGLTQWQAFIVMLLVTIESTANFSERVREIAREVKDKYPSFRREK